MKGKWANFRGKWTDKNRGRNGRMRKRNGAKKWGLYPENSFFLRWQVNLEKYFVETAVKMICKIKDTKKASRTSSFHEYCLLKA